MPSRGHHLDDVERFSRQNSSRRKVVKGDHVAGLGHDDDGAVAGRNVSNLFVAQRSHEFRRGNRFVVGAEMTDLKFYKKPKK